MALDSLTRLLPCINKHRIACQHQQSRERAEEQTSLVPVVCAPVRAEKVVDGTTTSTSKKKRTERTWRSPSQIHTHSAAVAMSASPMLALSDDLLAHILCRCTFDELRMVFACSKQLSHAVPAIWRSAAWRGNDANEQALRRAAWSQKEDETETCVGAFGGRGFGISNLHLTDDARVVLSRGGPGTAFSAAPLDHALIKMWDVSGSCARCTHTIAVPAQTASDVSGGHDVSEAVAHMAARGSLLVVVFCMPLRRTRAALFEVFDLRATAEGAGSGAPTSGDASAVESSPLRIDTPGVPLVHEGGGLPCAVHWAGEYCVTLVASREPTDEARRYDARLHVWRIPPERPADAQRVATSSLGCFALKFAAHTDHVVVKCDHHNRSTLEVLAIPVRLLNQASFCRQSTHPRPVLSHSVVGQRRATTVMPHPR